MIISEHPKHHEIFNLLNDYFIMSKNNLTLESYKKFINYNNENKYTIFDNIQNLNKVYLDSINDKNILKNKNVKLKTFSTDLPTFIKSQNKSAKTIMICAMDSLPPEPSSKNLTNHPVYNTFKQSNFDLEQNINYWIPFSLVGENSDSNYQFFKELNKFYHLYITDIFKLFFYVVEYDNSSDKILKIQKSNQFQVYKNIVNHSLILKKEIEIIKPECIITLGNNSRDQILKTIGGNELKKIKKWKECTNIQEFDYFDETTDFKCKIYSSPHISGSANGASSQLLKHHMDIEGDSKTIKMANLLLKNISK